MLELYLCFTFYPESTDGDYDTVHDLQIGNESTWRGFCLPVMICTDTFHMAAS